MSLFSNIGGLIFGASKGPPGLQLGVPLQLSAATMSRMPVSKITSTVGVAPPAATKSKITLDGILNTVGKIADVGTKVATTVNTAKGRPTPIVANTGSGSEFKSVYNPVTGAYDFPEVVIKPEDDLIQQAKDALAVLSGNKAIKTDNALDVGGNMTPILWGGLALAAVMVFSSMNRR